LLDMGEPVKIVDLAKQMIRLSGFKPMDEKGLGDIEIQFTGLRPGEKLYEELLIDQENIEYTNHQRILKAFEKFYNMDEILDVYTQLEQLILNHEICELMGVLQQYVDGYKSESNQ